MCGLLIAIVVVHKDRDQEIYDWLHLTCGSGLPSAIRRSLLLLVFGNTSTVTSLPHAFPLPLAHSLQCASAFLRFEFSELTA